MRSQRLLVHIPFHFVAHRWVYLEKILRGFNEYPLAAVSIVVDSNTPQVKELIAAVPMASHCSVDVHVHETLSHPFALTWAHRPHMESELERWDYFMYIEDDIYIPWAAFHAWAVESPALAARGYVRGFLRVETDSSERTVSTDWMETQAQPRSLQIGARRYIRPKAFYQACWVYSQAQMRRFVASSAWKIGFHKWASPTRGHRGLSYTTFMREYSAFGMACAGAGRPPLLLPLDGQGRIAEDSWIWHLPNNYGMDPKMPGGRLAIDELIEGDPIPTSSVRGGVAALAEYVGEGWNWLMYALHTERLWERVTRRVKRASAARPKPARASGPAA